MSNFIPVSDKYAIASDSRQWMIKKSHTVTDKETKAVSVEWVSKTFYGNFGQCVHSLGQEMLRTSECNNYSELVEAAEVISKLLNQKFPKSAEVRINHLLAREE
jgi:hypothetical protein